jgi:tetratricopeptide (TPR) repeat protein
VHNPLLKGFCCLGLGHHEDTLGNWDSAIRYYQQSGNQYWQVGNVRRWGDPEALTAILLSKQGKFAESFAAAQEITRVGEESGDMQLSGWGAQIQGLNLLYMGLLDGAVICMQKAIDLLWEIPDYLVVGLAKKDLGRCCLRQGKLEKGIALVEESCQILAEYKVNTHHDADFYNGLAEAYLWRVDAVGDDNAAALKSAGPAVRRALKYSKRFKGRLPVAWRLEGLYQYFKGKVPAAKKCWQKSIDAAEKTGARYELGATYLEFGRRCGERSYLEQARDIFRETGADFDLAVTNGLLQEEGVAS